MGAAVGTWPSPSSPCHAGPIFIAVDVRVSAKPPLCLGLAALVQGLQCGWSYPGIFAAWQELLVAFLGERWPLRGRDRRPGPPEGGLQDKRLDQFTVLGFSSCYQQAESEGEVRYPRLGHVPRKSQPGAVPPASTLAPRACHHPQIHRVLCAAKAGMPHLSAGERPHSPPMEGLQTPLPSDMWTMARQTLLCPQGCASGSPWSWGSSQSACSHYLFPASCSCRSPPRSSGG